MTNKIKKKKSIHTLTPKLIELFSNVYQLEHRNAIIPISVLENQFSDADSFKQTLNNLVRRYIISYSVAEYYLNEYLTEMNLAE